MVDRDFRPLDKTAEDAKIHVGLKADTKIYDFLNISGQIFKRIDVGDISSFRNQSLRRVYYLQLGLDFKQYGTPLIRLEPSSYVYGVILGYDNKANIHGVGIKGSIDTHLISNLPTNFRL